jgi:hypothetical protein
MDPDLKAYYDYLKQGHKAAPPPSILIPALKKLRALEQK